jgi:TatD DNase family protein
MLRRASANQYDEIIKKAPLDKMMIETDAPFVAPPPWRGQRNEPLYVQEVAKRIAKIRGLSYEKVAEATTKNALKFFKIVI